MDLFKNDNLWLWSKLCSLKYIATDDDDDDGDVRLVLDFIKWSIIENI